MSRANISSSSIALSSAGEVSRVVEAWLRRLDEVGSKSSKAESGEVSSVSSEEWCMCSMGAKEEKLLKAGLLPLPPPKPAAAAWPKEAALWDLMTSALMLREPSKPDVGGDTAAGQSDFSSGREPGLVKIAAA